MKMAFNPEQCKLDASVGVDVQSGCEAKCKFESRGTCFWKDTSCVRGPDIADYKTCVENCVKLATNVPIVSPPSECSGGPCDCGYGTNCFLCNQIFFDESGTKRTFGTCLSTKYSGACSVFKGESLTVKPDTCDIITPIKVPPSLQPYLDKVNELTKDGLKAAIEKIIANIPEAKDFLLTIRDPTPPKSTDIDIKVEVLIDITGPRDLTLEEKKKIADNLLKPAFEETTGTPIKDAKLEKLSTTSTRKRQTGETTYVATFSGDGSSVPGPNNTSSASVLATTLTALFAMFVALIC